MINVVFVRYPLIVYRFQFQILNFKYKTMEKTKLIFKTPFWNQLLSKNIISPEIKNLLSRMQKTESKIFPKTMTTPKYTYISSYSLGI